MPINYKNYPPNWKTEIVPRILDRAGNRCEQCGVENGSLILRGEYHGFEVYQNMAGQIFKADNSEYIGDDYVGEVATKPKKKVTKVVLTVAHLDHDPKNWNVKDDRLKAMCQRCHLAYDRPMKMAARRRKIYKNSLFPFK